MGIYTVQGLPLPTAKVSLPVYTSTAVETITSTGTIVTTVFAQSAGDTIATGDYVELSGNLYTSYKTVVKVAEMSSGGNAFTITTYTANYASSTGTCYVTQVLHLPTAYMGGDGTAYGTITSASWDRPASAVLVTVEGDGAASSASEGIRFGQGGTKPVKQTSTGHLLTSPGSMRLEGREGIRNLWIGNQFTTAAVTINVTPYIEDNR